MKSLKITENSKLKFNLAIYILLLGALAISSSHAQDISSVSQKPAEVEADEMNYLEKEGKIIAKGNVNVTQSGRILKAEEVTYNQNSSIITAKGNIDFKDTNGNQYYAESVEIDDQLSKGTITSLTGKLSDKSLISARSADRENEELTILHNAAYTPCKVCPKEYGGEPLWKITADKVRIDENKERISYKHAKLNILGVPVLYTPYFSHATPDAGRKSGLLIPTYNNISTLGFGVKVPYYINIAPNIDATFEPIFTSQEGTVLSGRYRHLLKSGSYELKGSVTNPRQRDDFGRRIQGRETRGHIEGKGDFSLSEKWGWGFDVKNASDDTYLRRYSFGNEDRLVSQLFSQYFDNRNYFGAKTIFFQGLNANDSPDTTPLVLPMLNAHFETGDMIAGSRISYDGNVLALARDTGNKSRRISNIVGWHIPYTTNNGHVFEISTSMRGDIYHVDDVIDGSLLKDGYTGRVIPEAQVNWSFPLAKHNKYSTVYIEPLANFIISPNGGNPNKIPNEDSAVIELSDTNLFSNNHFTGLDRVEGGTRTNYGVRGRVFNDVGEVSFLTGQSFRSTSDESFTEESGLNDNFSDYVGRVTLANHKGSQINYRFRVDKDDFVLRHNEISANVNIDPIAISTSYVSIDELDNSFDRDEIAAAANIKLNENWSINATGRRDLDDGSGNGGWRAASFGLIYDQKCLTVTSNIRRDYVRDRDIEPSTTFLLQIALKNLGSF